MIIAGAALVVRAMFAFGELPPEGTEDPPAGVFGMVAGLPLLLFGLFAHISAVRRYTGRLLGPSPVLGVLPLVLIGVAVGSWWGWLTANDAWLWVPFAATAVAILVIVLAGVARMRRRARDRDLQDLVATGRIVAGVVTEIAEIDPSSGGLLGPITVKFTDAAGTERWVTKIGQWRRADLPRNGDPASVLFDPADAGNTARIWIGPPGAQAAGDFTV